MRVEVVSLHPINLALVTDFVRALESSGESSALLNGQASLLHEHFLRAQAGNEASANKLTTAVALTLARSEPVFSSQMFGLSFWEARVDRSLGMMMRPPSRLLLEAGIDRRAAHSMPIRLDSVLGQMGGAWIPARLIPAALQSFDEHLERSARRLVEAELDAERAVELMFTALSYAAEQQVGLFEAQDIVGPNGEAESSMRVIGADRERLPTEMAERIRLAVTPPKKPGLLDRLRGRGSSPETLTGQGSDVTPIDQGS